MHSLCINSARRCWKKISWSFISQSSRHFQAKRQVCTEHLLGHESVRFTPSISFIFRHNMALASWRSCLNLCSYWWFISENEFVMSQVISNFTTVTLHRHDLLQVVTSKFWLEDQGYPPACQVQCWRGNRTLCAIFLICIILIQISIIFTLALCSYCVIENLKQF